MNVLMIEPGALPRQTEIQDRFSLSSEQIHGYEARFHRIELYVKERDTR